MFCARVKKKNATVEKVPPARRLILLIVAGTLPLFLILPIKDAVEGLYANTFFVGGALLVTGLLLYFCDRLRKGRKNERSASIVDALIVGLGQAVATCPGISRSGMTISMGCFRGFERRFAVRFAFLLSIPAVLGANILVRFCVVAMVLPLVLYRMMYAGSRRQPGQEVEGLEQAQNHRDHPGDPAVVGESAEFALVRHHAHQTDGEIAGQGSGGHAHQIGREQGQIQSTSFKPSRSFSAYSVIFSIHWLFTLRTTGAPHRSQTPFTTSSLASPTLQEVHQLMGISVL